MQTHWVLCGRTAVAVAILAALVAAPAAFAHAEMTPSVAQAKDGQLFTLAVPTEKAGAQTTKVELTPPEGFGIDSFAPSPGWKRAIQQLAGSGGEATIQKVTWTGGSVSTGEDAVFQFIATPESAKTYTFGVRQTYSDGSVVDWNGPEDSDTPSARVEAVSSLGGGSSSTLAIVALVLGGLALVVAGVGLFGSRRPLA
ncbi:MAG TPA: DUF1775 domain-containing protein [Gaiellaceae bacterium]